MRAFIDTSAFYALLDRDDQSYRGWLESLGSLLYANNKL
jgi:predicted nucleic acid-binding protein